MDPKMDPFHFEHGPAMGYSNANTTAGLTFQGQKVYAASNDYDPYGSPLHSEYALSQSKYTLSTGSGADMGVAVGLGHNMGLGITNMNTSNGMGMSMNMNMNVYTNPIEDMTPGTLPYGDFDGTTFNVQSYLSPPHTMMSHEFRSAVPCSDTVASAGVTSASGTRPIAIPLPRHHFHSAPQFALSPSVQSSPPEHPWFSNYYSASPAASASSMSYQSDDFARRSFKSINPQTIPVSPSPSTPYSVSSPASLADKAPAEESPLLQRVRRKKPAHSFECQKCGKSFTRGADVKRHESSVHSPQPMDCPVENCIRKGSIGFPRRDHLMEHLRTFHNYDIPKRSGSRKRKAYAMLDDSHMM